MTPQKNTSTNSFIATSNNELNKLRAAVLGANDGIVSTAGIILGVTGAAASKETVLIAGFAGLIAGALSMAAGEFVSVSSQRDSEKAFIKHIQENLESGESSAEAELATLYVEKGFSETTAALAASELQQQGAVEKELEKEIGIDSEDISNPWSAAIASASAFTLGAAIPLIAVAFSPEGIRLWVTIGAVLISLVLAGALSANAGQANKTRAALRIVVWGIGAMAITYAIGWFVGGGL